jgi:hypothetical protein
MSGAVMHFRENSRAKRENDFGLENALAARVRRLWPDKTIAHVQHEWDLSESEAAKVVYANASKNTLKKLLHHRRGGFGLFIELLADACNTTLDQYIMSQAERAAHERRTWEAEERRLAALSAIASGDSGEPGGHAEPAWGRRATDARVGRSRAEGAR